MNIALSTGRPAHAALPANLLVQRGANVTIFTAAYRRRFRRLSPRVRLCWVPQFVPMVHFASRQQLPRRMQRLDTALYDRLVAFRMQRFDLFWGWASGALDSGRAARRLGARFVLDRACPHVDVQQALVREESERLGVEFIPEPQWFRDRQLAEYQEADLIVVPSAYSRRTFPREQQEKIVVAPLFGRTSPPTATVTPYGSISAPERPFTFGSVGAQPLRKGFLYLLEAWEQLQLPNAQLLLRTDAELHKFPALQRHLQRLPNVHIVRYSRNMSDFYRRCDAFVLPTIDDGFGMVVLEAIAHGLPVITTKHCGSAELFTPGEELLSVPPQDSEALAGSMQKIYSSADLRDQLSRNARHRLKTIEDGGEYTLYSKALDRVLQALHPLLITAVPQGSTSGK